MTTITDPSKYLSPLISCLTCRKEYSTKGIFTHFISSHTEEGKERQMRNSKLSSKNGRCESKVRKEYNLNPNKCANCDKILRFESRFSNTCSYSCGGKIGNKKRADSGYVQPVTDVFIQKCRESRAKRIEETPKYTKITQCEICNKFFPGTTKSCSIECLKILQSIAGRRAASTRTLRSKDEIKLFDLCSNFYNRVESNKPIFNGWDADIIIHDTKTAILWNGPWHYKEMGFGTHSLSQVQNRDRIKIKEIIAMGWKALIFEDRMYTPESAFEWLKMSESNCSYSV